MPSTGVASSSAAGPRSKAGKAKAKSAASCKTKPGKVKGNVKARTKKGAASAAKAKSQVKKEHLKQTKKASIPPCPVCLRRPEERFRVK